MARSISASGFVTPIDVYSTPSMIFDFEFHVRDLIYEALQEQGHGRDDFGSIYKHVYGSGGED